LVGLADGSFQKSLGKECHIRPVLLNAGPSAIEALFAGELDMTYIGPNPAINGYVKSKGQALRIIAGASSGGAALVVRSDSGIASVKDFAGKRVASPQLGNTQDIALRYYLSQHSLASEEQDGTVKITPMQNADILTGFLRKEIDAAWVPEPWGARLVHEAAGQILIDERDLWPNRTFPTAVLIVSAKALHDQPVIVQRWLRAHVEVTQWINQHPVEAKQLINGELHRLTGKAIDSLVLDQAWSRLQITYDPMQTALHAAAEHAVAVGFLGPSRTDLSGLIDAEALNAVLKEEGLSSVPQ